MGGICSRLSCGMSRNDGRTEEDKYVGVQVVDPINKEGVPQNYKTEGSLDTVTKNGINERPKDSHRQSISERVLGSKKIQKIKSIVGGTQGAQSAAGWPTWLTSVVAEAIQGWVHHLNQGITLRE